MEKHLELIRAELATHLVGPVEVFSHDPMGYEIGVRWGRAGMTLSGQMARRDWFERDGTGWDAYGVTGMNALFMQMAMRLDGAPEHRIPPVRSGIRLSAEGRRTIEYIAADLRRYDAEHRFPLPTTEPYSAAASAPRSTSRP